MSLTITAKKIILPVFILSSLAVVSLIYWWGYKIPSNGIDDANIYFVYMKNLAQGHGFVWNVGGEKVEGFTSLLWTLIGALFYAISPAYFQSLLLILCGTLSFFLIYKILRFSRTLNNTREKALTLTDLILLSLLLCPRGFPEWNILSLMETSLWSFLLVSVTLQLCSYYFNQKKFSITGFSFLLVLLNLTRPESMLLNLLFILVLFVILFSDKGLRYSVKKILFPLFVHIVTFTSIILWRMYYFGFPFPNTYYAKVSTNRKDNFIGGLHYIFSLFYNYPHLAFIVAVLIFFAIFLIIKWRSAKVGPAFTGDEKIQAVLLAVIFSCLALPVLTGPDHFMFNRLYQPILPLVYIAATHPYFWKHYLGVTMQGNRISKIAIAVPIIFAASFFSKDTVFDFAKNVWLHFPEFDIATNGRTAAEKLNETFAACKEYPSIGSMAVGGVGYKYKGKTIDLLGLNNTLMAHANGIKRGHQGHASFDKGAFWVLKPDIMGTAYGGDVITDTSTFILYENMDYFRSSDFMYVSYKEIYDDDDFKKTYIPALVKHKDKDFFIFSYYEQSFLRSLDSSIYFIKILERKFNPDKIASKNN